MSASSIGKRKAVMTAPILAKAAANPAPVPRIDVGNTSPASIACTCQPAGNHCFGNDGVVCRHQGRLCFHRLFDLPAKRLWKRLQIRRIARQQCMPRGVRLDPRHRALVAGVELAHVVEIILQRRARTFGALERVDQRGENGRIRRQARARRLKDARDLDRITLRCRDLLDQSADRRIARLALAFVAIEVEQLLAVGGKI